MGSGLILLLIVGAWLAVLVPMGLRSHDHANAVRSSERFGDAMRVLSRRTGATTYLSAAREHQNAKEAPRTRGRVVVVPPAPDRRPRRTFPGRSSSSRLLLGRLSSGQTIRRRSAPPSPPARRRRAVLALVAILVALLVAGSVGPAVLLVGAGAVGILLAVFLGWCRVQIRHGDLERPGQGDQQGDRHVARRQAAARHIDRAGDRWGEWNVAGIPDRMPARPAPACPAEPAPQAVGPAADWLSVVLDDFLASSPARIRTPSVSAGKVRNAVGESWQPVPVPLPTYLDKAVVPRAVVPRAVVPAARPPRVLDLTEPGAWSAAQQVDAAGESEQAGEGSSRKRDALLDRRRVAGGW